MASLTSYPVARDKPSHRKDNVPNRDIDEGVVNDVVGGSLTCSSESDGSQND